MSILNGKSISQLNNFAKDNKIDSNDCFITSQQAHPNLQTNEYLSKSLTYNKLTEQLFEDLSAAFGFKSMAYELSDQYSSINHQHKYNFFDIKSDYHYNDKDESGNYCNTVLATFKIENKIVRLCMPNQWIYEDPGHLIGELKFKILPNIIQSSDIDINSDDFDGWVYPNGQIYTVAATKFTQAKTYFGQAEDSTTLSIPCLNNFIKVNPGNYCTEDISYHNEGVSAHTHTITAHFDGSAETELPVSFYITDSSGNGGSFHRGSKPYNPQKTYSGTIKFEIGSIKIKSETDIECSDPILNREQYPSYNYLPVMIYIGKK